MNCYWKTYVILMIMLIMLSRGKKRNNEEKNKRGNEAGDADMITIWMLAIKLNSIQKKKDETNEQGNKKIEIQTSIFQTYVI